MDADATPRTNPLLWWLAVLIQTEVLDNQPRWQLGGIVDNLEFTGKLEAIDHYARVLILDFAFHDWIRDQSPQAANQSEKEKVIKSLDAIPIDWIDQDQERPRVDRFDKYRAFASLEWRSCYSYINPILAQWLTDRTRGPICDIIKLRRRKLIFFRQRKQYCVKMEIYEYFTTNPCISDCYPAQVAILPTIKEANKAARKALRDELGRKQDARIWHEVYEDDGRVRIRAVYQDLANDAKDIAWVEEEVVNEPINDDGDDDMKDGDDINEEEDVESEDSDGGNTDESIL